MVYLRGWQFVYYFPVSLHLEDQDNCNMTTQTFEKQPSRCLARHSRKELAKEMARDREISFLPSSPLKFHSPYPFTLPDDMQ